MAIPRLRKIKEFAHDRSQVDKNQDKCFQIWSRFSSSKLLSVTSPHSARWAVEMSPRHRFFPHLLYISLSSSFHHSLGAPGVARTWPLTQDTCQPLSSHHVTSTCQAFFWTGLSGAAPPCPPGCPPAAQVLGKQLLHLLPRSCLPPIRLLSSNSLSTSSWLRSLSSLLVLRDPHQFLFRWFLWCLERNGNEHFCSVYRA